MNAFPGQGDDVTISTWYRGTGITLNLGADRAVKGLSLEAKTPIGVKMTTGSAEDVAEGHSLKLGGGGIKVADSVVITNYEILSNLVLCAEGRIMGGDYSFAQAEGVRMSVLGAISDGGAGFGLGVTKFEGGMVTLGGTNTYMGETWVDSGTLRLAGPNGSVPGSKALTAIGYSAVTAGILVLKQACCSRELAAGANGGCARAATDAPVFMSSRSSVSRPVVDGF